MGSVFEKKKIYYNIRISLQEKKKLWRKLYTPEYMDAIVDNRGRTHKRWLDHILLSPHYFKKSTIALQVQFRKYLPREKTRKASDHFPIYCDLEYFSL